MAAAKKQARKARARIMKTTVAAKALAPSFQPGDIVLFQSVEPPGTVGPGRVCSLVGFNQACVMFGDDIGCKRVGMEFLRAAPPGSEAPSCDSCTGC